MSTVGNEQATYAILNQINKHLNKLNKNNSSTLNSSYRKVQVNLKGKEVTGEEVPIDEEDETNTVIENECENDYDDIYQTLEEDLEEVLYESEDVMRQRELDQQKQELKRQIMMVAGPVKNRK